MKNKSLRFTKEKTELQRIKKRQDLFSFNFDAEKIGSQNCENMIGSIELPVGIVGPLNINSDCLSENIFLPFATTEGALVASYNRGCKVINVSGGAKVLIKNIGMTRAPVFSCLSGGAAMQAKEWFENNFAKCKKISEETSNHLSLKQIQSWVRGKNIFVRFVFDTDQAMGMNMVSIALSHLWNIFLSKDKQLQKLGLKLISLSSNVCTDKKDSQLNKILGRGYWVQAEVFLNEDILKTLLKTTSKKLLETHVAKNLVGSNIAGSFSQNMHVANGLAAMFLATGQDVAHVVEGSQASTTVERVDDGVYFAVTLSNLNLGVVGGGTWILAQSQARNLIREGQDISAEQLAVVFAAGVLAGEISGLAALSNHSLVSAHKKLARKQKSPKGKNDL